MKYDFKTSANYIDTGSVKNHGALIERFFGLKYYDDSISLWVSEMDFLMAPEIGAAIKKRVDMGVLGYTGFTDDYYNSFINWLDYKHNVTIKKEWIVPSEGTLKALRNSIRAFTTEGDKIIIQTPVYGQFKRQIEETKRVVALNPLLESNGSYSIDFDGFEALCKQDDVKMFIFCNPHNPVGNVWSEEDVVKLLDISNKYGVLVFSDEVHAELVRKDVTFHSTAKYSYDNLITAFGLGKAFNITGMHITNLVIRNRKLWRQFAEYTGFSSASPITIEAVKAAYNFGREWLAEVNTVIESNLEFIDEFIKEHMPRVKYRIPEGTYLVWLDFRDYTIGTKDLTEKIAEGKVVLESGLEFGEEGEGFIRMMAATPKEVLEEALIRIQKVLESLD